MRREDRQLWDRVARTVERRPGAPGRAPLLPASTPLAPKANAPKPVERNGAAPVSDPRPAPSRSSLRLGAADAPRRTVLPDGTTEPDAAALDALRRWWTAGEGWAAPDGRGVNGPDGATGSPGSTRGDAAIRTRATGPAPRPDDATPTLDRHQQRRLARGRTPIERRVDLHGLTEAAAHRRLLEFLHGARSDGLRSVLVITGKGASKRGGEGALKRAVPRWLATPPFSSLVSGIATAARHDGGEGALYVRLRR